MIENPPYILKSPRMGFPAGRFAFYSSQLTLLRLLLFISNRDLLPDGCKSLQWNFYDIFSSIGGYWLSSSVGCLQRARGKNDASAATPHVGRE
jgi:hypothetical protein